MKTENLSGNNSDPIWANNVELLPSEECLPIIGSCQVSSILQNLDTSHNDQPLQNMDLIILNGNDYKLPLETPLNLNTNNYIILKDPIMIDGGSSSSCSIPNSFHQLNNPAKCPEKLFEKQRGFDEGRKFYQEPKNLEPTDLSLNIIETSNSSNTSSISPKHYDKESFEDMLYFVCNLCPFLCTKEIKITEHLESAHKSKISSKLVQLKCPACANIFYHRASLKSHLLHDHCVASDDLNLIVQAILFYSNKENKKEERKRVDEPKEVIKINESIQNQTKEVDENKISPNPKTKSMESTSQNKIKVKEVLMNLVKPAKKISIAPKLLNEEPLITPTPKSIEPYKPILENQSVQCQMQPQNPLNIPEKIPLPQVDITANNSEKLITNLMKKDTVVPCMNLLQRCVYPTCKVAMSDPKKLDYHIDSHWNDGFRCLECQKIFLIWKPLTNHLWLVHKLDMELYSCDKCDYKSNSLSKLNTIHKLTHSTVKAFKCTVCQKPFKNQKQLRNHRRIHREVIDKEMETCDICQKNFSDKKRLKIHINSVHKKLKPFLCNYCGYKGACRASLRMHVRIHTGEKPFSCDQCEYSTADHNSLRRHKLRHTGQKPYKCSICSYACIQSSTYKAHLKTKHPGMEKDFMFTCFMCQFRTVNKDMYNTHLVTVHKQSPSIS